jgi:hypothetical protein
MALATEVGTTTGAADTTLLLAASAAIESFLAGFEPGCYSGSDAEWLVKVFAKVEHLGAAGKTLAARRAADAHRAAAGGHRNDAEWLAGLTGESVGEAKGVLALGSRLEAQPGTREAFAKGRLSRARATTVAGAVAVNPAAEAEMVRAAEGEETLGQLRHRGLRAKAKARTNQKAQAHYDALRRSRSVRTWTDDDGAFRLAARLTPDAGAGLLASLRAEADRVFEAARRAGLYESPEAYAADALVALVTGKGIIGAEGAKGAPGTGPGTKGTGGDTGTGSATGAGTEAGSATGAGTEAGSATGAGTEAGSATGAGDTPGATKAEGSATGTGATTEPGPGTGTPDDRRPTGSGPGTPDGAQPTGTEPTDAGTGTGTEPTDAGTGPTTPAGRRTPDPKAIVRLTIDLASLQGDPHGSDGSGPMAELAGVGPVPLQVIRELLGDACYDLVVTKGVDIAAVCHLGRAIPVALQRALAVRDPHCVVPGCGCSQGLEIDHYVTDYANDGPASMDNLARLCRHHHQLKTHQGFRLLGGPGSWRWLAPGEGDPPAEAEGHQPPGGQGPPGKATGPPATGSTDVPLFTDRE